MAEEKVIKTKNSPLSINTISQTGDNTTGKGGKPKSNSWWRKTRWLRWTLSFIVAATAVIIPLLLNNNDMLKEINVENSPLSINTIDQIGNNTINVGEQQRNITQDTQNQLASVLPKDKNQTIEVNSIDGDTEAFRFAIQIKEYLQGLGYSIAGVDKRIYSQNWTDTHIFTNPDGSVKEIIVGRRP